MATAGAEKRASKNVVRDAIRQATNPPPRACRYLLSLIGHYSDWTTGRNAHPGTMTLARLDGTNERNLRRKLRVLYDGHWIDVQDGPDPGPDRVRFYDTFRTPDHRPTVWRLALETLRMGPGEPVHGGAFKACSKCNPDGMKGRVTGVVCDTRTGVAADRERVSSVTPVRVSPATGVRVSPATDLPAVDLPETRPDLAANLAAGVRTDVNGGAPQGSSAEVERMTDALLSHVLEEVQRLSMQTSTPQADRAALVSLRSLLFPDGKVVDDSDTDDPASIFRTRLCEILTVAQWLGYNGKKKPFILAKHRQLSVAFSPTEFPTVLSQANAWEDTHEMPDTEQDDLEAEWQAIRAMVDPDYTPPVVTLNVSKKNPADLKKYLDKRRAEQMRDLGLAEPSPRRTVTAAGLKLDL